MAEKSPSRKSAKGPTKPASRGNSPPPLPPPEFLSKCLGVADVMLVALDREGRITLANRKAASVLGWEEEHLLGRDWFETCIPPPERAEVRESFATLMRGELTPIERFENPVLTKTGESRLIAWHNTLLTGADGSVEGTLSSGQDITEARASARKLEFLGRIAEEIADGMAVADAGGHLLWVNRAWAEMHGYSPQELTGKHLSVGHTDEQLASEVLPFNEIVMARGSHQGRVGHVRKDGTTFNAEMTTTLLREPSGEILGILGTARDITDQEHAASDLREAQLRLDTLVANSPVIIYSCHPEGDFAATYVSETVAAVLGYAPEEFIQDPGFWLAHIHPEDAPEVLANLGQLFERDVHTHRYRFRHRDGSYRWMRDDLRLMRDAAGRPRHIVGSWLDITETMAAQDALRLSEARYRTLVENIQDGVFIIRDEKFEFVNEAFGAILGLEPHALEGRRFTDFVAPEDLPLVYDRYRRRQAGEPVPSEYDFHTLHRDGATRNLVHMNVGLVHTADGIASMGTAKDITERKAMEDALRAGEMRTRALLSAIPDLIFLLSPDGVFLDYHTTSEDLLFRPPAEFLGKTVEEILPPDLAARLRTGMRETEARDRLQVVEYDLPMHVGTRYFEARVVRQADGKFLAIVRDTTQREMAEEARRQSEERFRRIFEDGPIGMASVGPDFRFTDANPAFCKMMGFTEAELLKMTFKEITHPAYLAKDVEHIQKLQRGEIPVYRTEKQYVRKNGGSIWGALTVTSLRSAKGEPAGLLAMVEDITDRKRAEEALRESESKYRQVFEGISEGIYVSTVDGHPILANPALVRMLGFDSEGDLNQRDIAREGYPDPEERERFRELIERDGRVTDFKTRWYRKDGSVITVLLNSRGVRDDEGRVVLYEGLVRDISEHVKAEEALRTSEETFRSLTETTSVAILIFQDGRFTYCNPAATKISGYSREEILALDPFDHIDPEDTARMRRYQQLRLGGEEAPERYEIRMVGKGGREIWVEISAAAIQFRGRPAILVSGNDQTERKRADALLKSSEERYRNIVEHSTNLFYSHTPGHVLTYVSPQSWRFFDCSPEEALVRWTEFVTEHPINDAGFLLTQRAIDEGEAQPPYELELRTRKGRIVWVQVNEAPVVRDGRTEAIVGALTDITERKAAEEALRESEAKYRLTLETVREIIYFVSADPDHPAGRMTFVSPQIEETLGYPPQELLGDPASFQRILHPKDRPIVFDSFQTLLSGKGPESREYRVQDRRTGDYHWVEDLGVPVRDAAGAVVGFQGVVRDITDRKRAEEIIRRKNLQLMALVDSSEALGKMDFPKSARVICEAARTAFKAQMVWIGLVDPETIEVIPVAESGDTDGYVRSLRVRWDESPRSKGPTGLCIKRRMPVTMSVHEEAFAPWRGEALRRGFQSVCAVPLLHEDTVRGAITFYTTDPAGFSPDSLEIMGLFARHTVLALVSSNLYHEAHSSLEELIRKEDDLVEKTAHFEELFQSSPEAVAILDPQDRILDVNRAFAVLFGWTKEEIEGRSINEVVVPPTQAEEAESISRRSLGGEVVEAEGLRRRKDGSVLPVSILGAPIHVGGQRTGVLAIYRDISAWKRAEEALLASEHKYKGLVETTGTGYVILGPDGLVLDANREYVRLAGRESLSDIVGRSVLEWTAPDDLERNAAEVKRCMETGSVRNMEVGYAGPNGQTTPVEVNATVVQEPDGLKIVTLVRDISDRKRAEDAVRIRDHALSTSVSAVAMSDLEGSLTYVNGSFLNLWGCGSEEEVLGRSVAEFWKNPEEAHRVTSALGSEGRWSGRMEARRTDGATFVAELSAHLVKSPDGRPLCMMASFLDVTEKVRSEEALSRSESIYRGMVENASAIVLTWEPCGKVTYWNDFAAGFFGFSREEILGRSLFDTIVPRVESTGRDLEGLLMEVGKDPDRFASNINQNVTKDGRLVWVAWANRPISGLDGVVQTVISYGTDITSLKEAESTLASSESRLKAIVDSVPECIKLIDAEGTLLDMNPAGLAMLGATLDQVRGLKAERIVTPEYRDAFREFTRRICEGERGTFEFEIFNMRGERLRMASSAAPLRLRPGGLAICLAITRVVGTRTVPEEPVVPD